MQPELVQPTTHDRRWPDYQPMVLVVLAFGSGILIDRWFSLDWRASIGMATMFLAGWYLTIGGRRSFRRLSLITENREAIASLFLVAGLIFAGAFWHHGRWNWFGEKEIGRFANDVASLCCVEADVISEPRWMADSGGQAYDDGTPNIRWKIVIEIREIRDGDQWKRATGVTDLVIHAPADHIHAGDRIRIFGRLVSSSPSTNPGQFNFQEFFRAKKRLAFIHAYHSDSVKIVKTASWHHSRWLATLRQKLNELTWRYVDHREAPFASAILLGNREQMSRPRRDAFMETGTIHLLAISGLHVGILAGSFFWLFRFGVLSRKNCLLATILFVIFYAWLVEFRPPVTRAAILVTMFCIGRLQGESGFSFNLLASAGMAVLMMNPSDLFGIGPQLSFLAVATLTFGKTWIFWPPPTDPIKRLIASTRPWYIRSAQAFWRQVRTAFMVCGLIWIVAMPLVAIRFHLLAPVSLLVNPCLILPIAWGLYGGLGVLVFGWFSPTAATGCGWFCDRNLALIEWMIAAAQSIPGGHFWTPGPSGWAVGVFYGGLFLFAVYPLSRLSGRWLALLVVGWLCFCWWIPDRAVDYFRATKGRSVVCTFIDVGHGTSVLLQMPDGKNVLYDAGAFGAAEYGARNIAGVLWSERISHLDAVVLSHADVDHFNAIPRLVEQFSIGVVYVTPQMRSKPSAAVDEMFQALRDHQIPVRIVSDGDRLPLGQSTTTTVLGPPSTGTGGSDNSDSLILLIEFQDRKILLPGDLEHAGLSLLLNQDPVKCDVVMAAHHGSENSMPEALMKWSTPQCVVISGGTHRVSDKTVARFRAPNREIARTDQSGAIRVRVNQAEIRVQRWSTQPW